MVMFQDPKLSGFNVGRAVAGSVIITGDHNVAVNRAGAVSGRNISIPRVSPPPILSQDQAFERIGAAVRVNLEQLEKNIDQARSDSSQFFKLTLVFASLGFLVVLAGVLLLLLGQVTAGVVSSIASIIPEVTAVLFFRKDKELRTTIERYHKHVLEFQRILTMIDLAETVSNEDEKNIIKRHIIYKALGIDEDQPHQMAPVAAVVRKIGKNVPPLKISRSWKRK